MSPVGGPWPARVLESASTAFRSSAVRLAGLFFVLFALASAASFGSTYLTMRAAAIEKLRDEILARGDAIEARLAGESPRAALGDASGERVAALFDASGALLAGQQGLAPTLKWERVRSDALDLEDRLREGAEEADRLLVHGRRVGDRVLVVGDGLGVVEEAGEALVAGLGWSLLITGLAALGGGGALAWRVRGRLVGIEEALAGYGAGDLKRRLPLAGTNDEIDRICRTINASFARVEGLVGTIRQVTTDAAHDLKTPMTRLRHRLEEAAAEAESGGDVGGLLQRSIEEADRIVATFEALLRISRVEAGAARARFERLDLAPVLETVVEAYAPDAEDAGQRLALAAEANSWVLGDRDLLTQAFANLVENAIRHAGTGVAVTVGAERHGARVLAEVRDAGPGVPEGERERVLGRFVRLEASRTTPGTGLGLALVKAVADLHGADIALKDAAPGLVVALSFPAGTSDR